MEKHQGAHSPFSSSSSSSLAQGLSQRSQLWGLTKLPPPFTAAFTPQDITSPAAQPAKRLVHVLAPARCT